jgi:hypothetical protein
MQITKTGKVLRENECGFCEKIFDPKDLTATETVALLTSQGGLVSNVQSDWNATSGPSVILNKPDLSSAMTYKGTKANIAALLADVGPHKVGDVWNVNGDGNGNNYAFSGTPHSGTTLIGEWDQLAGTIDLSGKVDKNTTTANQIYGTAAVGVQTTYTLGTAVNNIPQRHAGGQIQVPAAPSANTDAASKQYVDTQISTLKIENWSIDLRDNVEVDFYVTDSVQIAAPTQITATSATLTITDDGVAYTAGATIAANSLVKIVATLESVWKITVTTL